jgi:hypothetical protein
VSSLTVGAFGQQRFESMVAVDEMVGTLAEELEAVGELNATYIIFTLPPPQALNSLNVSSSRSIRSSLPVRWAPKHLCRLLSFLSFPQYLGPGATQSLEQLPKFAVPQDSCLLVQALRLPL